MIVDSLTHTHSLLFHQRGISHEMKHRECSLLHFTLIYMILLPPSLHKYISFLYPLVHSFDFNAFLTSQIASIFYLSLFILSDDDVSLLRLIFNGWKFLHLIGPTNLHCKNFSETYHPLITINTPLIYITY